jgi:hypothetical protein
MIRIRRRVLPALGALGIALSTLVTVAGPSQADNDSDPLCYTTPSTSGDFYPGPSASRVYDWTDVSAQSGRRFSQSVAIPSGPLDGHYVPQGLAAWPNWNGTTEDLLLISAYKDADGDKTPDGPSAIWGVVADGSRAGTSLGRMLITKGHVGGIGVYKGWLYVGSEYEIRGYRLSKVGNVLAAANTNTVHGRDYNRTSSYRVGFMGTGDGHLWAGAFNDSSSTHLNGYVQTSNSTGALAYQSATQAYAPKKTQGVAVTSTHVIFSTSYGRNDRGNIWVMGRGQQSLSDGNSFCFRAPSMNQGLTIMNSRLYLNFESGAYTYNKGLDDPDNPIRHLHSSSLANVTGLYGGSISD